MELRLAVADGRGSAELCGATVASRLKASSMLADFGKPGQYCQPIAMLGRSLCRGIFMKRAYENWLADMGQ
jgi:hypothetical protein